MKIDHEDVRNARLHLNGLCEWSASYMEERLKPNLYLMSMEEHTSKPDWNQILNYFFSVG